MITTHVTIGGHVETKSTRHGTVARRGYGWIIPCFGGWSGVLWHVQSGVAYDNVLGRAVFASRTLARAARKAHPDAKTQLGAPVKVRIDLTLVKS